MSDRERFSDILKKEWVRKGREKLFLCHNETFGTGKGQRRTVYLP
ncbi:hypothetical protein [Halobacillus salinus]|nr:hypothetical protein [Halobacillus salinus]